MCGLLVHRNRHSPALLAYVHNVDGLSSFLKAALLSEGHRAQLFLRKDDVVILNKMGLKMAVVAVTSEPRTPADVTELWESAQAQFRMS